MLGDIMALTGNLKTAGDAIGDKDLRVLQEHYLGDRETKCGRRLRSSMNPKP